jgi:hypothetical protein
MISSSHRRRRTATDARDAGMVTRLGHVFVVVAASTGAGHATERLAVAAPETPTTAVGAEPAMSIICELHMRASAALPARPASASLRHVASGGS